jgi:hypothetical protein
MSLTEYVVIDTETGGLGKTLLPWEIALLKYNSAADSWNSWLIHVSDYNVFEMEPEAANLNGFFERYGKEPLALNLTARAASGMIDDLCEGLMVVGSSPPFDKRRLLNLGCSETWHHRERDVPTMAVGLLGYETGGLQSTADILEIQRGPQHGEHTAMGDAVLAKDTFVKILEWKR